MTLVLGYCFLQTSGMYFLITLQGGIRIIALKLWYIRLIQIEVIRDTDDCEIPNRLDISSSGKPIRSRTKVMKSCSSNDNLLGRPHLTSSKSSSHSFPFHKRITSASSFSISSWKSSMCQNLAALYKIWQDQAFVECFPNGKVAVQHQFYFLVPYP